MTTIRNINGINQIIRMGRRLPSIFHVNKESRKEAAWTEGGKWYPLDDLTRAVAGEGERKIYVELSRGFLVLVDCLPNSGDAYIWGDLCAVYSHDPTTIYIISIRL